MKRNRPVKNFTFAPEALALLKAYAQQREIGQSTALSELILDLLKGDKGETNPKVIEQAISALRESDEAHRLA